MENCSTCKFWMSNKGKVTGACEMVDSVIKDQTKTFEIDAYAHDDSGMCVTLVTGSDFGCIHHTQKQ